MATVPESPDGFNALYPFFEECAEDIELARGRGMMLRGAKVLVDEAEQPAGTVIIATGWKETYFKYLHVAEFLYQRKFHVFMFDHRCQGLSSRHPDSRDDQASHIERYDDYVDDLEAVAELARAECGPAPLCLLAHSMGGMICCTLALRRPDLVDRLCLSAPCFSCKAGPWPTFVVAALVEGLSLLGLGAHFVPDPDHGNVSPGAPVTDIITHDAEMLSSMREMWAKMPEARIGGAAVSWLREQIRHQYRTERLLGGVAAPVLLFQADEDVFVYNSAMNSFRRRAPHVRKVFFPGAYHELFMEVPQVRNACLQMAAAFFAQDRRELLVTEDAEDRQKWNVDVTHPSGLKPYALGILFHRYSVAGALLGALAVAYVGARGAALARAALKK